MVQVCEWCRYASGAGMRVVQVCAFLNTSQTSFSVAWQYAWYQVLAMEQTRVHVCDNRELSQNNCYLS